jgi:hypothetical protein
LSSFLADKFRFTPPFHIRYIHKELFALDSTATAIKESDTYEDEITTLAKVAELKEKYGAQYIDFIFDANGEEVSRHE